MRLLVVVSEPITAALLRDVAARGPEDAEVFVVSPASTHSPLRFWVSDVDDAIAHAEEALHESVEQLDRAGIDASGEVGDSDQLVAIEDALNIFPADRVVVIQHEPGERDYREDGDVAAKIRERFDLPVDVGTVAR